MEVKSREEAAAAVKRGADLCALLGVAIARQNKEVLAVQQKHAPSIDNYSSEISNIKAALQSWAESNRSEFGGVQSLEFPAGVLAFHQGQRGLETLPRWTWKKVLAAMKRWKKYLRPKVEIDKRKVLADSAGENPKLTAKRLAAVGMKVVQEESFNVEFRVTAELEPKE
jgi:phage host-nuclease inhibitor protein Gam